ncbi:unnamed protein product [Linum tenue]|uniref:Uncharacterized protein n=1 Tax=Linum tenue TaxID=586396 RepID=A0AAV0LE45_9ROSI|nr:unnamed protein product [Linum tenue]
MLLIISNMKMLSRFILQINLQTLAGGTNPGVESWTKGGKNKVKRWKQQQITVWAMSSQSLRP